MSDAPRDTAPAPAAPPQAPLPEVAAAPAAPAPPPPADVPPPPPGGPAETAACPISLDVLSANFRKHVDPVAPAPLRMMGAKGLVPMAPKEMATALYMLTYDPDANIRETAQKTAAALPDRMLSVALRDDTLDAQVLQWYALALTSKVEYQEMIVLNPATSDETVALLTAHAPERVTEIIAQNQLRLLRHEPIVRALIANTATRPSTLDSVTDFCVRSGLILNDLQAFRDARRRILGGADLSEQAAAEAAAQAEIEEQFAVQQLEELGAGHSDHAPDSEHQPGSQGEADASEHRRKSITQQLMNLSVAKKVEWANKKGNKEVRTILLRDPNKLVQMAVVQSPRITEDEIAKLSNSRILPMEVLSFIYNNRQLTKNYQIKINLVNNPKVPVAVSMRFLVLLRTSELKTLSKNKNIPNAVATAARNLLEKKNV